MLRLDCGGDFDEETLWRLIRILNIDDIYLFIDNVDIVVCDNSHNV